MLSSLYIFLKIAIGVVVCSSKHVKADRNSSLSPKRRCQKILEAEFSETADLILRKILKNLPAFNE